MERQRRKISRYSVRADSVSMYLSDLINFSVFQLELLQCLLRVRVWTLMCQYLEWELSFSSSRGA